MPKQTIDRIRRIYGIVLSVALIVTGILLMISCVNIYRSGSRPFTPDSISAAFSKIEAVVWVSCGVVALGVILNILAPAEQSRPRAVRDGKVTLARLQSKLNTDLCDPALVALIRKEEKLRARLRITAILACVAVASPAVVYALDRDHFGADYNAAVLAACLWILPTVLVCMGICVAFLYLEDAGIARQTGHVKSALAKTGVTVPCDKVTKSPCSLTVRIVRAVVAVVAIAFIAVGVFNGGMADVLSKAINICTECIGLG